MNHPSDEVAVNGPTSLSDRVQELRLSGKMDDGRVTTGGTAWLPWVLCFFVAVGWAGYAIKWYRAAPGKSKDDGGDPAAATSSGGRGSAADPRTMDAVTLEVKGYLIPTQQISISPIDVAGRVIQLNIEEGM